MLASVTQSTRLVRRTEGRASAHNHQGGTVAPAQEDSALVCESQQLAAESAHSPAILRQTTHKLTTRISQTHRLASRNVATYKVTSAVGERDCSAHPGVVLTSIRVLRMCSTSCWAAVLSRCFESLVQYTLPATSSTSAPCWLLAGDCTAHRCPAHRHWHFPRHNQHRPAVAVLVACVLCRVLFHCCLLQSALFSSTQCHLCHPSSEVPSVRRTHSSALAVALALLGFSLRVSSPVPEAVIGWLSAEWLGASWARSFCWAWEWGWVSQHSHTALTSCTALSPGRPQRLTSQPCPSVPFVRACALCCRLRSGGCDVWPAEGSCEGQLSHTAAAAAVPATALPAAVPDVERGRRLRSLGLLDCVERSVGLREPQWLRKREVPLLPPQCRGVPAAAGGLPRRSAARGRAEVRGGALATASGCIDRAVQLLSETAQQCRVRGRGSGHVSINCQRSRVHISPWRERLVFMVACSPRTCAPVTPLHRCRAAALPSLVTDPRHAPAPLCEWLLPAALCRCAARACGAWRPCALPRMRRSSGTRRCACRAACRC